MAMVHAVGLPVNNSERKAIRYLANKLPHHYTIFHNLELPAPSGQPYEYDMIIVGEHAVYVVDVKGYGGVIKGNAQEWSLSSGAFEKSPIPLLNKTAKIVKDHLKQEDRALEAIWTEPLVVLTDNKVRVKLKDQQAERVVLHLAEAVAYMLDPARLPQYYGPITPLMNRACAAISSRFQPLQPRNEIGDYRIVQTMSRDDRYTTLLAEHRLLQAKRRFTLKVYHLDIYANPKIQQKRRQWILRDAEALQALAGHANIVRAMLPFPWQDSQMVLPVEWVDGYSLRGLLDAGEEFSVPHAAAIMRQVCAGLDYAHQHGVIHRDLRPNTIIIPNNGPVKLVNFDCARIEETGVPTIGDQIGHHLDRRYAAPEVLIDPSAAAPASDQYSAGMIFFELLTGQLPYQDVREVIQARGLPRLPTQVKPDLPHDVDEVISRMCALSPQQRYPSLAEVSEDMEIISSS